jgi:hypothetical protein
MPAQAGECSFLDEAEELGLDSGWNVADFVQEERAPRSAFKVPGSHRGRTGEGVLLVTEKFTFQQLLGKRAAHQRDERFLAPRTVVVDHPCDECLACSGGAGDECRSIRGGGVRNGGKNPLYGFDTGMVCYARGWDQLRTEDCGVLWEHLVLDTLIAAGLPKIHFWRDKQQREVDFIVPRKRDTVDAIECKWKPPAFETRGLAAFREWEELVANKIVDIDKIPKVA